MLYNKFKANLSCIFRGIKRLSHRLLMQNATLWLNQKVFVYDINYSTVLVLQVVQT